MAVNNIYIGESRGELIAWINELLTPTQITKVEECGKGAIYCQIMDSIYGNVPLARVKFNAKSEYEYLENYKILKTAFIKNKVDKPIPVERLVKCKMQDNLEFLQWMKKWWDNHTPGGPYDATARSGGQVQAASGPSSSRATSGASRTSAPARAPMAASVRGPSGAGSAQLQMLNQQVAEMQAHAESVERERDFYFDKLRQVEVIVQERLAIEGVAQDEKDVLLRVQAILYSTEDGFEQPLNGDEVAQDEGEEETF